MHLEILKAHFSFSFWIMRAEVVLDFRDKRGVVSEPRCIMVGGKCGFEPVEHSSVENNT